MKRAALYAGFALCIVGMVADPMYAYCCNGHPLTGIHILHHVLFVGLYASAAILILFELTKGGAE